MKNNISTTLKNALYYASRGWFVFPLHTVIDNRCSCRNPNCESPGKHPRTTNGFKDASLDANRISAWWRTWPDSNVAIMTGERTGFFAVDVDPRHLGDENLEDLEKKHGRLPDTVQALTGGGGKHILFACDPDLKISSRNNFVPGVDIKANGGYIVAPPSLHTSGQRYAWDTLAHPDDVQIVKAPSWLLTSLSVGNQNISMVTRKSSSEWRLTLAEACKEGNRHSALARVIGHLISKGVDLNIVAALVVAFDRMLVTPPQGEPAVLRLVRDIAERHMNRSNGRRTSHVG